MVRRLSVLVALVWLSVGTASAQDARTVLQAAVKAMGGTDLKTIQYSGAGWFSQIGQTYGLAEDWPHYEVADYTRLIDYGATWSREDYTRRQGNYPTLGRTPMAEEHVTAILSGTYTLGPGIRLVGGVFWYDGESEGNVLENDGYGVATGFKLGF